MKFWYTTGVPTYDETEHERKVIVEDEGPADTGLFDAAGQRLYRVAEKVPVGFVGSKHNG